MLDWMGLGSLHQMIVLMNVHGSIAEIMAEYIEGE